MSGSADAETDVVVVGAGNAAKDQIGLMVRHLLPGCRPDSDDAADALAIAICHAHLVETGQRWSAAGAMS